jgi:cyclic-di-GMP phosphodiesterase TipF (flagellum assembly factor)
VSLTILTIISLILTVVNTVVLVIMWRESAAMERIQRQLSAMTQRHDREIAQQRYALASLRQIQEAGVDDGKTDQQMLDEAVGQLDEIDKQHAHLPAAPAATMVPDAAIGQLSDKEILQFVKKAIQNNQLAISRQPIVTLPKRQIRYYEIFSRILVGDQGYIPAHKFISVARGNNLMGVLDNILLLRCLQLIKQTAQKEQTSGYFVNISSSTLANKTYVNDLIEFLQHNPKLSSSLVFEITQDDSLKISPGVKSVMEGLALLGVRFSMDQVTIFGMDPDRLVDLNINFVKMDSRVLEKEMNAPMARGRMKKIKNTLEAQGVQVIAEKIENEKQLLSILDLYVDFGQGYLFGQPEIMA